MQNLGRKWRELVPCFLHATATAPLFFLPSRHRDVRHSSRQGRDGADSGASAQHCYLGRSKNIPAKTVLSTLKVDTKVVFKILVPTFSARWQTKLVKIISATIVILLLNLFKYIFLFLNKLREKSRGIG